MSGAAGTDTALPATDSKVTVNGRGEFADLEITVNQTRDLVNQAVSVTWKGGVPTTSPVDGSRRTTSRSCSAGAIPTTPCRPTRVLRPSSASRGPATAVYGGRPIGISFPPGSFTLERIISRTDFPNAEAAIADGGVLEEATGYIWRAFRAVKGGVVTNHYDPTFNPSVEGGEYWRNPAFDAVSTNEIPGGRTRSNGTGQELFEVATGQQNDGLGCGQAVEPVAGGTPRIPKCWLVVVPRGDAAAENEGTGDPGQRGRR